MESFIAGVLLGFGVAIPIGPLNILIMTYSLNSFKQGFGLGLGAMSADILYFMLLSLGILVFLNQPFILKILGIFGSIFLLYMSYNIFKNAKRLINTSLDIKQNQKLLSCFAKGFLLNSINPFIIGFWLSLSSVVANNENVMLSCFGVVIALFAWIFGLSFITSKAKKLISDKVAKILAYTSSFLMIAFALFLLYSTFLKEIYASN